MKAMILAAGFGTRLRPLTSYRPKALVPVVNKPLIHHIIQYLQGAGIKQIVVNAHHMASQISSYFQNSRYEHMHIRVVIEDQILGTGGAIKNVEDFWDNNPFLVINGDILTNIDLEPAFHFHAQSGALATLILHHYPRFNQILLNKENHIIDFSASPLQGRLAFTGIHIIAPQVLDFIPPGTFFNIIDAYRKIIQNGFTINAYVSNGHYWRDLGTLESYLSANREYVKQERFVISPEARLDPSVRLLRWAVIGDNAYLEEGVKIEEAVVWDNSIVPRDTTIVRSVVTPHTTVRVV